MRVRKSLVAGRVGASAVAILLLAAAAGCSGSTQKPATLGATGGTSAAPSSAITSATAVGSSSASASAPSSAPSFKFPADYSLTVDPDLTGDPVKDAILADNANFMRAYLSDLAAGNASDSMLLNYATPGGVYNWLRGITDERSKGLTITGTERIYRRVVDKIDTSKTPAKAYVYVCDDQSKAFDKEIATGKIHVTPVTDSDYILYFFGVQKAANGTWQVANIVTHKNDQPAKQECQ